MFSKYPALVIIKTNIILHTLLHKNAENSIYFTFFYVNNDKINRFLWLKLV